EVSHIRNGDMVTMTLLQGVINAFVMFFARVVAYAVRTSSDSRNSYMLSYVVMIVLEIGLGILGSLITAWFSRHREFSADAGGAVAAIHVGLLRRRRQRLVRSKLYFNPVGSFRHLDRVAAVDRGGHLIPPAGRHIGHRDLST